MSSSATEDGPNYKLLGAWVRRRRRELALTQADVHAAGGPSTATLRQVESGEPLEYRRQTTDGLEKALKWASGTIAAILAGQDPAELHAVVVPDDQDLGVLASLPPSALEGLDDADKAEIIAAATLRAHEKAREIRKRLNEE